MLKIKGKQFLFENEKGFIEGHLLWKKSKIHFLVGTYIEPESNLDGVIQGVKELVKRLEVLKELQLVFPSAGYIYENDSCSLYISINSALEKLSKPDLICCLFHSNEILRLASREYLSDQIQGR